MNPESKKPLLEMPKGDETCRLLVMGHLEPGEWKTGAQDAPVVGDSTFRQLIAAGLDEDGVRLQQLLKGTLKNRKCKPANRKIRQLWRKFLVRFNAEAGQHLGQDSGGNASKSAQKTEGQKSKIKINVKRSMDKAMAMQDYPNTTQNSLR